MTGPEHYRRAEVLVYGSTTDGLSREAVADHLRAAQIHATLAVAVATALAPIGVGTSDWIDMIRGEA